MRYVCQSCNRVFNKRKRGDRAVKYCSTKCAGAAKKGKTSWNKGIPCREETKHKLRVANNNKRNSIKTEFKKGDKPHCFCGEFVSNKYIYAYTPHHPNCSERGYVLKHRLVAERELNRFLTKEEVIHHIDEDPTNNDPTNLYLFCNNVDHLRHHRNKIELKSNLHTTSPSN